MMITKCPHCSGVLSVRVELEQPVAANTATPKPTTPTTAPNGLVPVDNLVTCRRCGRENLAWQKSKTGKNYLCLGVIKDGQAYASRREFHECTARGSWPNTGFPE